MKKTLTRTRLISLVIIFAMVIGLAVTVLSATNWTQVGTFAEFKSALENASVTRIRLTNDIQMIRGGAEINSARTDLIIDGNGFAIHGHNSNTLSDTLRYSRAGRLNNISVLNTTIVSQNRNGFININSGNNFANIQVTFRGINFFGPQLINATDSNVTIGSGNYTINPGFCKTVNELAEANHIRIEEAVTIFKDANGKDEIFRIERAGGGITVTTGAYVNVSLNQNARKANRAGFVHFQRTDGYIRFENDSFFNYVGNGFFQQHRDVQEVVIGDRAQVHIRTHGNFKGCYGIFMISGHMTVGQDAIVNLIATGNTKKDPVIQLDKKTSTINVNSPRQFFVYNTSTKGTKGNAIGTSSCTNVANVFYNNITDVAYWRDNVSPHDNLSTPTFSFFNNDESAFSLSSSSTRSKVNNVGSENYHGTTQWNANTAYLRDVNVILIGGGTGGGGTDPEEWTVMFNSNGGTPVENEIVIDGELLTEVPEPYRYGYTFAGWFLDPNFTGQEWDFYSDIVKADFTLHARWILDNADMSPYEAAPQAEQEENENYSQQQDATSEQETLDTPDSNTNDSEASYDATPEQEVAPEAAPALEPAPAPEPAPEIESEESEG